MGGKGRERGDSEKRGGKGMTDVTNILKGIEEG